MVMGARETEEGAKVGRESFPLALPRPLSQDVNLKDSKEGEGEEWEREV
jgi:hypothetical protein